MLTCKSFDARKAPAKDNKLGEPLYCSLLYGTGPQSGDKRINLIVKTGNMTALAKISALKSSGPSLARIAR